MRETEENKTRSREREQQSSDKSKSSGSNEFEPEALPLRKGSIEYKDLIKILDLLKHGFENKRLAQVVELFTEDAKWKYHPHDPRRIFDGKPAIQEMYNDEFNKVDRLAMSYFPNSILFDQKNGRAYVEWVLKSKVTNEQGKINIKHITSAVQIFFQNNRISTLKSYSMKTIDAWVKDVVTYGDDFATNFIDQIENDEIKPNTKKESSSDEPKNFTSSTASNGTNYRSNNKARNRKKGGRARRYTRNHHNGINGHYHEENYSNNGGPHQNHSNNGGRHRNHSNNGGRKYKNGKRGRNGRNRIRLPWTCSVCNVENTSEDNFCRRCQKRFQFAKDLTEEQKQILRE